jgi:RpiB/LacA/LacB family sugar-phosphate isomerase
MQKLQIYLCCDHAGFHLKEQVKDWLQSMAFATIDLSPKFYKDDDYPDKVKKLAVSMRNAISIDNGQVFGIAICGSGQGMCMSLNRYSWIRAALIIDNIEAAELARAHNDANVLCLGASFINIDIAKIIVETFLKSEFSNEVRHKRRISKLGELGLN